MVDKEEVFNWLAGIDRQGLSMTLQELEQALATAPEVVKCTQEFHYLRRLHDGRFLSEEIR